MKTGGTGGLSRTPAPPHSPSHPAGAENGPRTGCSPRAGAGEGRPRCRRRPRSLPAGGGSRFPLRHGAAAEPPPRRPGGGAGRRLRLLPPGEPRPRPAAADRPPRRQEGEGRGEPLPERRAAGFAAPPGRDETAGCEEGGRGRLKAAAGTVAGCSVAATEPPVPTGAPEEDALFVTARTDQAPTADPQRICW